MAATSWSVLMSTQSFELNAAPCNSNTCGFDESTPCDGILSLKTNCTWNENVQSHASYQTVVPFHNTKFLKVLEYILI